MMSRPRSSVPIGCAALGPAALPNSSSSAEFWTLGFGRPISFTISGARIATTISRMITPSATSATRSSLRRRQNS